MPTPVCRDFLRGLKAKKEDEKRIKGVNERVNHIYYKVIESAELYSYTSYKYPLTQQELSGLFSVSDTFYREKMNMKDILICLQLLFTDCIVMHVHQGTAIEGILIDWT